MCFIIVIWGRKTMRNQQLQTDYTEGYGRLLERAFTLPIAKITAVS